MGKTPPKDTGCAGDGKNDPIPVPRGSLADFYRVQDAFDGRDDHAPGETTASLSEKVSRLTETVEKLVQDKGESVRPTYTVKEAAQLLGKSTHTVRRWIREGKLQSTKTSDSQQGQHLITHASLAPFLHGT